MDSRDRWLSAGLFLTTLATLLIELLDSRLLSVLTWYHLSFIAISLAMLGGASGAVLVFLAGRRLAGEAAHRAIGRISFGLAIAIPLTHLLLMRLRIPPLEGREPFEIGSLALAVLLLTLPFLLSGAVVTLALTRCGGRIGILYGSDLLGAAAGCALIVPLLDKLDMFSAAVLAGGLAALAARCYTRFAGHASRLPSGTLAVLLLAAALLHSASGAPIGVLYPRGQRIESSKIERAYSNAYSHVTVFRPRVAPPFYWGPGRNPRNLRANSAYMFIDGGAGTALTQWNGQRSSIEWVKYDVTTLPHYLRSGKTAVIGVGGGRDILSALWGGSRSVTAIEINEIFVEILTDAYRDFASIADQPTVRIVNDEARAYLTRTDERFDVLQMSLVDTWAATGAGAFTLSENALYTVEAWKIFLSRLEPGGIFSTSRWFSPDNVSETSRLLSLCVRTLLELGVEDPSKHIALVAAEKVATLLLSPDPLPSSDIKRIHETAAQLGFRVLVAPGETASDPRLAAIVSSTSPEALAAATADPHFDYSPPTDARPYFFNLLKLGSFHILTQMESGDVLSGTGGVIWGNVRATFTLMLLLMIALCLTLAIIGLPLLISGLPRMDAASFGLSVGYFAAIGYGFMSIQIPLLQRFSVFLGHPIYTYSVILFTMILFAGFGSLLSDRLERLTRWSIGVPLAIAALTLILSVSLQPLLDAVIGLPLAGRVLIVMVTTAPLSLLLGFCFPIGMRLVGELSPEATAWMWGVNGASGVLASIVAVAISMWTGIHSNFAIAAVCYLALALLSARLCRRVGPAAG